MKKYVKMSCEVRKATQWLKIYKSWGNLFYNIRHRNFSFKNDGFIILLYSAIACCFSKLISRVTISFIDCITRSFPCLVSGTSKFMPIELVMPIQPYHPLSRHCYRYLLILPMLGSYTMSPLCIKWQNIRLQLRHQFFP